MEKTFSELKNEAEHLLYNIHLGQWKKLCNLCKKDVLWKYNHNCSKGIIDKKIIASINTIIEPSKVINFEHIQYYIHKLPQEQMIITGVYCIHKYKDIGIEKLYFDYTIIFSDKQACYVQIIGNDIPVKIHRVVSVTEVIYNMQENEILYIEAMGDHILWHCRNTIIESADSLKNAEVKLSKDFIRVHRSYVVNKRVVTSIQRCSATIINGDIVPIPYKKYVNIKNELLKE